MSFCNQYTDVCLYPVLKRCSQIKRRSTKARCITFKGVQKTKVDGINKILDRNKVLGSYFSPKYHDYDCRKKLYRHVLAQHQQLKTMYPSLYKKLKLTKKEKEEYKKNYEENKNKGSAKNMLNEFGRNLEEYEKK